MEIVLAALVAAGVAVAVVLLVQRPRAVQAGAGAVAAPERGTVADAGARPRSDGLEEELRRPPHRDRASRGAPARQGELARRQGAAARGAGALARGPRPQHRPRARGAEGREGPSAARARARGRPERRPGQADDDARARGRPAPRERAPHPPGRGGDPPRRRPARAQHPRRRDAARGVGPRRRDDRVRRRAQVGRAEGPHHRPRGPQHPDARDAHRHRLHHRRHPRRGAAVGLRRRAPRDRAAHARAAAAGRPHPPGPDRGVLPPGQVGDRPAHRRGGGAGGVRGERRLDPPGARQAARQAPLPHELRPERAAPLDRVRAARVDARRRAGRRPARGRARGAAARHRQGRVARDRGPARARRAASWRAATRSPRPWRTRWRRTTTRSSCRRSRP